MQSITRKQARTLMRRLLLELGIAGLRIETRNVRGLCQIEVVKPRVQWPKSARQLLRPHPHNADAPCQRIVTRARTWVRALARARHVLITADARRLA